MKVIGLKGKPGCGKTTALNEVATWFENNGAKAKEGVYRSLEHGDFFNIYEYMGKLVGLISQGDYVNCTRTSKSVKAYLIELREKGCDIAICACSQREDRTRQAEDQAKAIDSSCHFVQKKEPNEADKFRVVQEIIHILECFLES